MGHAEREETLSGVSVMPCGCGFSSATLENIQFFNLLVCFFYIYWPKSCIVEYYKHFVMSSVCLLWGWPFVPLYHLCLSNILLSEFMGKLNHIQSCKNFPAGLWFLGFSMMFIVWCNYCLQNMTMKVTSCDDQKYLLTICFCVSEWIGSFLPTWSDQNSKRQGATSFYLKIKIGYILKPLCMFYISCHTNTVHYHTGYSAWRPKMCRSQID